MTVERPWIPSRETLYSGRAPLSGIRRAPMERASETRFADSDWLRVFAVLLLVYSHTAAIFVHWDSIINNGRRSLWADIFVLFLDQWYMPLFFLIAGAATRFSLGWRSAIRWRDLIGGSRPSTSRSAPRGSPRPWRRTSLWCAGWPSSGRCSACGATVALQAGLHDLSSPVH